MKTRGDIHRETSTFKKKKIQKQGKEKKKDGKKGT